MSPFHQLTAAAEGKDDLEEGDSSTTVIGEQAAQVATRFDKILQSMLRVMIELTAGGAADVLALTWCHGLE